jgi:hypothetical protein
MNWKHGSSGTVPALQIQSPVLKSQSEKKEYIVNLLLCHSCSSDLESVSGFSTL